MKTKIELNNLYVSVYDLLRRGESVELELVAPAHPASEDET